MPYKRIIRPLFQNKLKPSFYRKPTETLISASQAWQQISSDFKGPVKGKNNYLLIAIDENSRFPFVFPCFNITRQTVINCLRHYFVCSACLVLYILTAVLVSLLKFLKVFFIFGEL